MVYQNYGRGSLLSQNEMRVSRSSNEIRVMVYCLLFLVFIVVGAMILSGGQIEFFHVLKAKFNSLGEGIRKLRDAFKD